MEQESKSKRENLWIAFIVALLGTVLGGFILLVLEYWTGWFAAGRYIPQTAILIILVIILVFLVAEYKTSYVAKRFGLSPLRSTVNAFWQRISPTLSRYGQEVKEIIGLFIPFGALIAMMSFLDRGAPVFTVVVLLVLMMFLSVPTINPPMGGVTGFLIFVGFMAAYVLLVGPPNLDKAIWPVPFSGDVSIANTRVVAYVLLLVFLTAVWGTSNIMTAHWRGTQRALRAELDRFCTSASFAQTLKAADEERYYRIVIEWEQALAKLASRNRRAAGFLTNCLPEKFEVWELCLGSKDSTTVEYLKEERHKPGKSSTLPSFLKIAEGVFSEYFSMPNLTVQLREMTESEYETTRQQVEGLRNMGDGWGVQAGNDIFRKHGET